MSDRNQIRNEVMVEIISVMATATDHGEDGWRAVEAAFPSVPPDVVAEAWVEVTSRQTENWWQTVERTINGEIIRNALKGR